MTTPDPPFEVELVGALIAFLLGAAVTITVMIGLGEWAGPVVGWPLVFVGCGFGRPVILDWAARLLARAER